MTLHFAGTMVLLALSFLTSYFYYIPRATLAAVLISAVIFMIDVKIIKLLWKGSSQYYVFTCTQIRREDKAMYLHTIYLFSCRNGCNRSDRNFCYLHFYRHWNRTPSWCPFQSDPFYSTIREIDASNSQLQSK